MRIRPSLEELEDRLCMTAGIPDPAGGSFHVAGGHIIAPNGNVFIARGINVPDNGDDLPDPNQILALFPGINFVRLAADHYPSAASMSNFVNVLTQHGVVVEIEDHNYPLTTPYTGTGLANETSWFGSLAATFKGNPYVWFGAQNEPVSFNGFTAEQVAVYNAVRGQGDTNPILLEAGPVAAGITSGLDPTGFTGGMNPSAYANMSNIVWDLHFYGVDVNGSADQNSADSQLLNRIQTIQTITSANGLVPVLVGETGPSANGTSLDANGQQAIYAATNWAIASGYTSGYAGWYWGTSPSDPNSMTLNGTSLTAWGQQMKSIIQNTPTPGTPTESAQQRLIDAVFTLAFDGAKLVLDANGVGPFLHLPTMPDLIRDIQATLPQADPFGMAALAAGANATNGMLQGG